MGACKVCYAEKQPCLFSTDAYNGCISCHAKGVPCEPQDFAPTSYIRKASLPKDEATLGLSSAYDSSSDSMVSSTQIRHFDDRGFKVSRPRTSHRRSGYRASSSIGATVSIDAIQVATTCSIVKQGLLDPSEVVELYHLYMTRWNPCVLVLDPVFHTLEYLSKSELLLSTALAVSAQDYPDRPRLYEGLVRYARKIAGKCLFQQTPSVDIVQAFILLSLFPDWNASFESNRSWLDLGLALDLANQLNMEKLATQYNAKSASASERNILRTWMICHNLDVVTTLIFDRPLSFGSIPEDLRPWPNPPDGSLEGVVGALTAPLQDINLHLKRHALEEMMREAGIAPANGGDPRSFLQVIERMRKSVLGTEAAGYNKIGGPIDFWLHLAHTSTEYSKLMLLSKQFSTSQDCNLPAETLDLATSILQSYVDAFGDNSCSLYTPVCFLFYGLLAAAATHKLVEGSDLDSTRAATLIQQFFDIVRRLPAITRNEIQPAIFSQVLEHVVRGETSNSRPGENSGSSNQEQFVPILAPWWQLYL